MRRTWLWCNTVHINENNIFVPSFRHKIVGIWKAKLAVFTVARWVCLTCTSWASAALVTVIGIGSTDLRGKKTPISHHAKWSGPQLNASTSIIAGHELSSSTGTGRGRGKVNMAQTAEIGERLQGWHTLMTWELVLGIATVERASKVVPKPFLYFFEHF